MTNNGLRWVRLCLITATTAFLTAHAWSYATATEKHTLKPGETLASVARTYHVPVEDIAAANHLANINSIRDGMRLTIPSPPKRVKASPTLHRKGALKSDRISLRMGPGSDYRRVFIYGKGEPLVVTALREGWAQVNFSGGNTGWVRQDFIQMEKRAGQGVEVASHVAAPSKHIASKKHKPATEVAERPTKSHKRVARHEEHATKHVAKKHRGEEATKRLAQKERKHRHALEVAKADKKRHHALQVAKEKARRHHKEAVVQVASTKKKHHSHRVAKHSPPEEERPEASSDIVRTAYAYRGTPYRWGGSGRGGFDCSGFTSYLYGKKGVSLPHSASGQFGMGKHVEHGSLKAGDLVFFHTVTKGIGHVGMYVGDGKFVHASSRRSGGVRVDSLSSGYYRQRFRGGRRYK